MKNSADSLAFQPIPSTPDSIQGEYSAFNHLELISKVQEFYSDSFSELLTITALLIGFIGIAFPLIQSQRFIADQKELKVLLLQVKRSREQIDRLEARLNAEINSLQERTSLQIEKINLINENNNLKQQSFTVGTTTYLMAREQLSERKLQKAIEYAIHALNHFRLTGSKEFSTITINLIDNILTKVPTRQVLNLKFLNQADFLQKFNEKSTNSTMETTELILKELEIVLDKYPGRIVYEIN